MKKFEHGLYEGMLFTDKNVLEQILIAQGVGDLGETVARPNDSSDVHTAETPKIYRSLDVAARSLRTALGENLPFAFVSREGKDRGKCVTL